MRIAILLLASGWHQQAINRVERTAALFKELERDGHRPTVFYLTNKSSAWTAAPVLTRLIREGVPAECICLERAAGPRTDGEVRAFVALTASQSFDELRFVTTWYHIPRVRIWARLEQAIHHAEIRFESVPARGGDTLYDWIREVFLAYPKMLYLLYRRKRAAA